MPDITVPLRAAMQTHEGPVQHLKIREPNAGDFMTLGKLPFDTKPIEGTDNVHVIIDFAQAGKWLVQLTGIDELLIMKLGKNDFMDAVGKMNAMIIDQNGTEPVGNLPG